MSRTVHRGIANALIPCALALGISMLPACRSHSGATKASLSNAHESVARAETTRSRTNSATLAQALLTLPPAQQEGARFLLDHMPERDLQELSSALFLDNVAQAYEAFAAAPWSNTVPQEIFLNDVLPYACLDETRDAWRKELRAKCEPLVKDCQTPGEAAQKINRQLFKLVNVRYSTQRKKAAQSPLESMESGLATCTGLSILLVDACRSVGVPARVTATPMWTNLRGNHTWVEIWDGDWHFTGAAEQDPKGLDRGWFAGDAAQARKDEPRHAIYASSYQKTGLSFPLVWARQVDWVNAINVTDRYAAKPKPADPTQTRLLIKVLDQPEGQRVAAQVTLNEVADSKVKLQGVTKDESADRNDLLSFQVLRERLYEIRAELGGQKTRKEFRTGTNAEEMVVLFLNEPGDRFK